MDAVSGVCLYGSSEGLSRLWPQIKAEGLATFDLFLYTGRFGRGFATGG